MNPSTFNHRPAKTWHQITITAPASRAEIISAFLASVPVGGIEQFSPPQGQAAPTIEKITAYLADSPNYNEQVNTIQNFIKQLNKQQTDHEQVSCTTEPVQEQDWNSNWKKHFKPFKLTDRIVIKPSWEPYTAKSQELVIEMDPGMAFGTGLHASTKLALLLIEELLEQQAPAKVLDVGTGTGILGMSCILLGAHMVLCLDNDIDARATANGNIIKNNLTSISVSDRPLHETTGQYDLVIANITCDILFNLADDLACHLAAGGNLILSGILAGNQERDIKSIFINHKFTVVQTRQHGEWVAIHFKSPQKNNII